MAGERATLRVIFSDRETLEFLTVSVRFYKTALLEFSKIVTCVVFATSRFSPTLCFLLNCHSLLPHMFCVILVHYLSGTFALFLCDYNARSQKCFSIVSKKTMHFVPLLFPFEALINHSCDYVVWAAILSSIFFLSFFHTSCPKRLVKRLHKVPIMLFYCFQVDTSLYYFLLSHWWPILIAMLCGLLHF